MPTQTTSTVSRTLSIQSSEKVSTLTSKCLFSGVHEVSNSFGKATNAPWDILLTCGVLSSVSVDDEVRLRVVSRSFEGMGASLRDYTVKQVRKVPRCFRLII